MRFCLSIISIICVLSSCVLSTEQEIQLNKDLANLISVRNNGDALSYLNLTHPLIVKYYKSQGDAVYKNRFQVVQQKSSRNDVDTSKIYWSNAYQKDIKSNDSTIQVKVEVSLLKGYQEIDSVLIIYAITKRKASNWLFVEEQDYFSDYFPEELRLFEN